MYEPSVCNYGNFNNNEKKNIQLVMTLHVFITTVLENTFHFSQYIPYHLVTMFKFTSQLDDNKTVLTGSFL